MAGNNPLSPPDQARLDSAIAQLLAEGLLWRERESDVRAYNALARWRDVATAQLHSKGWDLVYHAPARAFHILHRRNKHRRSLKRDTALTLLVCRLLFVETPARLTPHPIITVSQLAQRCARFGLQLDLSSALPELEALKLVRAPGGRRLYPTQTEQLIELLPTLTVVVPDTAISQQPTANNHQPIAVSR